MAQENKLDKMFKKHKVLPDVVQQLPGQSLQINYSGGQNVDYGNVLTPTQVKSPPKVVWDAEADTFYTLIMTDPDAPSRAEPKFREWHHWLVTNIPGSAIDQGDVLTEYVGSAPPKNTGLHRYVFLLYKQPGKVQFNEPNISKTSGSNRGKFSAKKFSAKYKLGDPIAANFYQAEYDDYVPTVYKQLKG
ncbi:protein D2-like [Teleopsis dalmanni]|uniref:protein D2-like n=1 Tax=Teleopsis dalmanni TaxID=139649 RepID=UPI0018CFE1A3|nr:protein D2-like [Teleopsis dalmanni]XP_037951498.1 protein D2-like [Teleopsis dalmanni]